MWAQCGAFRVKSQHSSVAIRAGKLKIASKRFLKLSPTVTSSVFVCFSTGTWLVRLSDGYFINTITRDLMAK